AFAKLPLELPHAENHVYARYAVGLDQRDELQQHLSRFKIEAKRPVYRPLHHYHLDPHAECPNAERAHRRLLSLPIYPSLKDEEVEQIIQAVRSFF
ncbi:MAG TPA: DegT/DnrJ/EryC1/StrS family aminotransferase, partial [Candidatus Hydrogenedentes bacterium]|nr:DegT/DnrJ/EryC1/StrS family aminotransferase [Candidatus Hydrogenedentota bacterium]